MCCFTIDFNRTHKINILKKIFTLLFNMKAIIKLITIVFLLFPITMIISSCNPNKNTISKSDLHHYSFFVAGHTYGNPTHYQIGLHPPFLKAASFINDYPKMKLGVLTGDVVPKSTQTYWDSALIDFKKFNYPIYIAAGNHDRSELFEQIFKNYYYQFKIEDDLFIILSPTNWSIENDQKDFLEHTINTNYREVNNIFIFCHELIWWSPENKFKNVNINYRPHYPGNTNYWSEIHPMLESLPNNIILFAGDLGCTNKVSPYMYYKQDNITLIGSGMGGGKNDNFIIADVGFDGSIQLNLINLNDQYYNTLGYLEDFEL